MFVIISLKAPNFLISHKHFCTSNILAQVVRISNWVPHFSRFPFDYSHSTLNSVILTLQSARVLLPIIFHTIFLRLQGHLTLTLLNARCTCKIDHTCMNGLRDLSICVWHCNTIICCICCTCSKRVCHTLDIFLNFNLYIVARLTFLLHFNFLISNLF